MKPYYDEGGITIYHADCRDVLPALPKVDLVLTDPPYGIGYNAEEDPQSKHKFHPNRQIKSVVGDSENFDPSRLLQIGCGRILWGANCYASRLPDSRAWLAWDKVTTNGLNLRIAEVEFAWSDCVNRSVVHRYLWSGGYRVDERGESFHPTQKPISLMRWCMRRPGVPGGLVVDPYMGSGTTLVAAKLEGRSAIGIEIEERYCEIAARRLSQAVFEFPPPPPPKHEQMELIA